MRKLSFCTRYIDDLWNPLIKRSEFQQIVSDIYPNWLQLGAPEHEGKAVNYLDMTMWCRNKQWHSKLYDKRIALVAKGLKLNTFPHPESKLSSRCKFGVITSQLHRFNIACTQPSSFIEASTTLYTDLIKKGYQMRDVDKYFEAFRRRHSTLRPHAVKKRYLLSC